MVGVVVAVAAVYFLSFLSFAVVVAAAAMYRPLLLLLLMQPMEAADDVGVSCVCVWSPNVFKLLSGKLSALKAICITYTGEGL